MKAPKALGGSSTSTYTAYNIKTVIRNPNQVDDVQEFEVSRRFSQFEKLLASLRQMQGYVVPELPKKRFFNSSETIIETRRSELETWLKTVARKRDL